MSLPQPVSSVVCHGCVTQAHICPQCKVCVVTKAITTVIIVRLLSPKLSQLSPVYGLCHLSCHQCKAYVTQAVTSVLSVRFVSSPKLPKLSPKLSQLSPVQGLCHTSCHNCHQFESGVSSWRVLWSRWSRASSWGIMLTAL